MEQITYTSQADLPNMAVIIQLERPTSETWRIVVWRKEDGAMSVVDIVENSDRVALGRWMTSHAITTDEVWAAFKGAWYTPVRLASKHARTNARHLNQALWQAYSTPAFADPDGAPRAKTQRRLPSTAEACELMRDSAKCSLAVRLECHQVLLRGALPIDRAQIAEALADLCQGVQILLGDQAE